MPANIINIYSPVNLLTLQTLNNLHPLHCGSYTSVLDRNHKYKSLSIHVINAILYTKIDKRLEFCQFHKGNNGPRREEANCCEIGWLLNGRTKANTNGKCTIMITLFHPLSIPPGKNTHTSTSVQTTALKMDNFCICWTVGGKFIVCNGETYTQKTDIVTTKLRFNSIIFTANAKFLGIDLNVFHLGTPMPNP